MEECSYLTINYTSTNIYGFFILPIMEEVSVHFAHSPLIFGDARSKPRSHAVPAPPPQLIRLSTTTGTVSVSSF